LKRAISSVGFQWTSICPSESFVAQRVSASVSIVP